MDEQRFDLFLTGHLAVGSDRERARQQLAKLFKRSEQEIDKLLRGRSSRIRKSLTAGDIERLQRGFDKLGILTDARPCPAGTPQQQAIAQSAGQAQQSLSLCPTGSPVLRPHERQPLASANIDTSGLSLSQLGSPLEPLQRPTPAPPNTDHLQIIDHGDGPLSGATAPPQLDLDALSAKLSLAPQRD